MSATEAASEVDAGDQLCDRVLGAATMFEQLLLPPPRINILGLPEWDFSAQQVKKAYREVSLQIHPDKCASARANDAFLAVAEAFRTLSDDTQRLMCINAYAEKYKSEARSKPQGWSPTESTGATTEAALVAHGVSAETISLASQTEIDVALARQDRIQADARQRASFQQHNDDMMKQLSAKRDEQIAAREKSEEAAFAKTKRSHRAMSRPAVSSSSSSGSGSSDDDESGSDDSNADDSDDEDVQRKLQELKNKKRRGFVARAL